MIGLPSETRVWPASGATDMRRGFDGLALVVQETLKRDPHCGQPFMAYVLAFAGNTWEVFGIRVWFVACLSWKAHCPAMNSTCPI